MPSSNISTILDIALKDTLRDASTFLASPILEERLTFFENAIDDDKDYEEHVIRLENLVNTCTDDPTRKKSLIGYVVEYGDDKDLLYIADNSEILTIDDWAYMPPDQTQKQKVLDAKIQEYIARKHKDMIKAVNKGPAFQLERFRRVIAIADDIITFPICTKEKMKDLFGKKYDRPKMVVVRIYS